MKNVVKTFITACVFALGATFMWSAGPSTAVGHCGASCADVGKSCTGGFSTCGWVLCHNGAQIDCMMSPM